MNMKKTLALAMAGVLSLSMLAGCSAPKTDPTDGGKDGEQVTLRFSWWGDEARHKATMEVIDLYTSKNPNVKIESEYGGFDGYKQKISTQIAGGTAPDIVQLNPQWLPEFEGKGDFFVDLNTKKDLLKTDGFDAQFLKDFGIVEDKLCALPTGLNSRAMYYNKTAANALGFDYSIEDPVTWEQMIEMGKKLNEANPNTYLMIADPRNAGLYYMKNYMQQKGKKQFINEDFTIGYTEAELADGLNFIKRLYDNKVIQPAADSAAFANAILTNPKVVNGEVLVNYGWASDLSEFNNLVGKENVGVMQVPTVEGGIDTGIIVRPAQVIAVPLSSKHQDEAVKFLDFFFNDPEAAKILKSVRSIPAVDSAREVCAAEGLLDENAVLSTNFGVANAGLYENAISTNSEIEGVIINAAEKIAYGKGTPESIAKETMVLLEDVLTTLK